MRFQKHYTRDEARSLLPEIRGWLNELNKLRSALEKCDQRLVALMLPGCDLGGSVVNTWVRTLASIKGLLSEFQQREILIKDLDRGLIDFPAILSGNEVFLCWEQGEEDIEFWHELDAGYAGRERFHDTATGE
jgi:Uncharacterized conserved protein